MLVLDDLWVVLFYRPPLNNRLKGVNVIRNKGKSLIAFPTSFTVIDIETTGLDPKYDEIIELSAVKVHNGEVVDEYSTLVKPPYDASEFITELTGITNAELQYAPELSQVLSEYMTFLGDDIIVGHNVNFDINFLYDKYQDASSQDFSNDFVDTLRLGRFLLRSLPHHRLIDLVEHYSIGDSVEHRGLSDAYAAWYVLKGLYATALEQYSDVEQLVAEFKLRANHPHPKLKANSVATDKTEFDITHPLFGQYCVFTGALEKMIRKDAFQFVVDCGGAVQDNVNKDTSYLIVGSFDYSSSVRDGKSGKLKRAEELILKGRDLTIISENVFYDMLEQA